MSGPNDSTNSARNACIVCYRNAVIYSIGMCEHPVCYECSTRMRVLCQQNECPICRQDLPKVVFSKEVKPFRFLKKGTLVDSRYNIYFDSPEIQEKFIKLLTHKCSVCEDNQVFSSFNSLKDHMRRKHDLHYCELCVDNLKIFSYERRCYSRTELSRHRRKGDVDDKSHKGHPLCEFCDQRYMDNDELYRHLRRDHLFCHFCDADGFHQYYSSYDYLRDHFQKEHFLCEEGGCADEQFTSVFRTDIDLKAHKASVHGKQLGKAAAKQARTLELEFTLAPRGDLRNRRGPPGGPPRAHQEPAVPEQAFIPPEPPTFVRQPLVDVQSTQEFPTLGNSTPCLVPNLTGGGGRNRGGSNLTIRGTLRQGNYDQNFPALGPEAALGSGPAASGNASGTGVGKTLNFSVTSSSNNAASAAARRQPNATPNLSIHVNHRPNGTVTTRLSGPNLRVQPGSSRDADFPALGRSGIPTTTSSSSSSAQTQASWTKVTCVKTMPQPKGKKVAPPPHPPSPPPLRSGEDFPSLSKPSKAKGQQQSVQSAASWVQVHPSESSTNTSSLMTDATKGKAKKKKKQQLMSNVISNGNTSSNESSSSAKTSSREPDNANGPGKKKSKDAEPSKKDKSKTPVKQNSEQKSSSNGGDNHHSQQQTSFNTSSSASTPTQRKRSELKIESLNTNNNNNNISKSANPSKQEDFPALGRRPPPGLSSPPPGFTAPATVAPPPGFMSRLNGLTFTNSSGETYTIVPDEAEQKQQRNTSSSSSNSNQYTYLPPANFQKRNQNLIAEFNACFGSQESEELKAFRYISGLFRTGECDADEYYKQCRVVMGAEAFKRVFPELLALLPDIDKQRELFKVHKREASGRGMKGLEACGTCGQIIRDSDLKAHCTSHTLENHFPALRTGPALAGPAGAWAKK